MKLIIEWVDTMFEVEEEFDSVRSFKFFNSAAKCTEYVRKKLEEFYEHKVKSRGVGSDQNREC